MSKTKDQAIQEINDYITRYGAGTTLRNWYVGITANPEHRLFTEHGVDKEKGVWIYRPTVSAATARAVEKAFLNAGAQGGGGGGDDTSVYVYAYKIQT